MAALTTIDNVRAYLAFSKPDTATDELLERLIDAASEFVEQWLGRTVLSAQIVEYHSGGNKDAIILKQAPITSVTSVVLDGRVLPAAVEPADVGWMLVDNWLVYQHGLFGRGRKNLVVTYEAGYLAVPADIEQAVIEIVCLRFKERDRIGHVSKSLAGETVTFMISDMSASSRAALQHYKRVII